VDIGTLVSCELYGTGVVAHEGSGHKIVDWFSGKKSVIESAWVSDSLYKQTREMKYKKVKVWKLAGHEKTHFIHVLSEVKE
jgi:hypothetical protein